MPKFHCLECGNELHNHQPGCSLALRPPPAPREMSDEDYERIHAIGNQRTLLDKNLRAAAGALRSALHSIDSLQRLRDTEWVEGDGGPAAERLIIRALDTVFGAKAIAKAVNQ